MEEKRFNELLSGISSSLKMKLDHIRKFLYLGQASAMVGAGFSKNAEMDETTYMKDWGQLADNFYEELYRKKPSDNDMRLKSPMKLASQVECTKGRAALDELIIKSLPDARIRPGKVHHDLVKLKWRDIFTTNYDTLLERAALDVFKFYNVVTSKDTILYKQSPRIVKLHGSFIGYRPFIISEEDYRTYPQKFPEFVNTVRQALIETIVCLFGFSGDDPNFLNWIGWIRDIMENKLSPIYLFSTQKEIHDSEIQLFRERKIEIIKLYDLGNIKSISEGFDFVFSYLREEFNPQIEWSGKLPNNDYMDKSIKLQDITNEMKQIRTSYPGWLLLPTNKIDDFEDLNLNFPFLQTQVSSLSDTEKIDFLYELDWRLTKAFMPKILSVDWYRSELEYLAGKEDEFKDELFNNLLTLKCSLLSIYRHIGDSSKFDELAEKLSSELGNKASILTRRISYEKCLKALGELDYKKIRSVLAKWDVNDLDYLGSIWKANVLIEIGEKDQGTILLDNAFNSVRTMLLNDSESVYLRSVFIILNDCISLYNRKSKTDIDYPISLKMSDYIDYIENKINQEKEQNQIDVTHDFNIGSFGIQWNIGHSGYNHRYIESFRYIILCESYGYSLGMPNISINSDLLKKIFPYIAEYNMYYALYLLVRSANSDVFEIVCSRKYISSLSSEEATRIFDQYLNIWDTIDNKAQSNGQIRRFKKIVFPLLSCLCVKIDSKRIIKFITTYLNFLEDYDFNNKYLTRAYNSLSKEDLNIVANVVYSAPIKLNMHEQDVLLPSISAPNFEVSNKMIEIIDNGIIDPKKAIRDAAYIRMVGLYKVASDEQKTKLNSTLLTWREKYSNDSDILYSYRLQYPHEVDCPESAKHILETKFTKFINGTYLFKNSSSPIQSFQSNLITMVDFLDWLTVGQIKEITNKIILFLKENTDVIQRDDSDDIFGGMRQFCEMALNTISDFCIKISAKQLDCIKVKELLDILYTYSNDYCCISALANLLFLSNQLSNKKNNLHKLINKNILSTDGSKIKDSFRTLIFFHAKLVDKAGIQDLITEVIYQLKYKIDKNSSYLIIGLSELIKNNAIKIKNLKPLKELTLKINSTIKDADISDEFKTDILYNVYRLIGVISVNNKNNFFTDAITKYKSKSTDMTIDNDIRQGFQNGIDEALAYKALHMNHCTK